jgi:hypothetical protein
LRKGGHVVFYLLQLLDLITRRITLAHRFQVDSLRVVGASDGEGAMNTGLEGAPFKLSHVIRDESDAGHKRAHLRRLRHPKVITDQVGSEAFIVMGHDLPL